MFVFTVTVSVVELLALIVPPVKLTIPDACAEVKPEPLALTNESPAGKVNSTATPVAFTVPLLLTLIV